MSAFDPLRTFKSQKLQLTLLCCRDRPRPLFPGANRFAHGGSSNGCPKALQRAPRRRLRTRDVQSPKHRLPWAAVSWAHDRRSGSQTCAASEGACGAADWLTAAASAVRDAWVPRPLLSMALLSASRTNPSAEEQMPIDLPNVASSMSCRRATGWQLVARHRVGGRCHMAHRERRLTEGVGSNPQWHSP